MCWQFFVCSLPNTERRYKTVNRWTGGKGGANPPHHFLIVNRFFFFLPVLSLNHLTKSQITPNFDIGSWLHPNLSFFWHFWRWWVPGGTHAWIMDKRRKSHWHVTGGGYGEGLQCVHRVIHEEPCRHCAVPTRYNSKKKGTLMQKARATEHYWMQHYYWIIGLCWT